MILRNGLIAILATVVVAQHNQPSQQLIELLPFFVQSLNRVSVPSQQFPNENIYLLMVFHVNAD